MNTSAPAHSSELPRRIDRIFLERVEATEQPIEQLGLLHWRLRAEVAQTADPRRTHELHLVEDVLARHLMPLARRAAQRSTAAAHCSPDVQRDLADAAMPALLRAIRSWQPAVDEDDRTRSSMRNWAMAAVQGGVLDALRELDLLPRKARRRVKEYERAVAKVDCDGHSGSRDREQRIAELLEVEVDEVRSRQSEAEIGSAQRSLDAYTSAGDESAAPLRQLAGEDDTEQLIEREQMRALGAQIGAAIGTLSAADRHIVTRIYRITDDVLDPELTPQAEVGREIGVTESRISQVRSRVEVLLQEQLDDFDVAELLDTMQATQHDPLAGHAFRSAAHSAIRAAAQATRDRVIDCYARIELLGLEGTAAATMRQHLLGERVTSRIERWLDEEHRVELSDALRLLAGQAVQRAAAFDDADEVALIVGSDPLIEVADERFGDAQGLNLLGCAVRARHTARLAEWAADPACRVALRRVLRGRTVCATLDELLHDDTLLRFVEAASQSSPDARKQLLAACG